MASLWAALSPTKPTSLAQFSALKCKPMIPNVKFIFPSSPNTAFSVTIPAFIKNPATKAENSSFPQIPTRLGLYILSHHTKWLLLCCILFYSFPGLFPRASPQLYLLSGPYTFKASSPVVATGWRRPAWRPVVERVRVVTAPMRSPVTRNAVLDPTPNSPNTQTR